MAKALPSRARRRLALDDPSAVGSRRLEIGGGEFPRQGYIHVDGDPGAAHLEAVADAWALPFPDEWATEIVAIHLLEHVPPPSLLATLREWRRVLAPGGIVEIHVPNTPELIEAFSRETLAAKWALMAAILGSYADPRTRTPEVLTTRADHQILFDWELLSWALEQADFAEIRDETTSILDRHTEGWRPLVQHCSLIALATKPGASTTI